MNPHTTPAVDEVGRLDDLGQVVGTLSDALELLGVLSYTVGQCVAFQDQRTVTAAMAMEVVARNIEAGNASALSPLLGPAGGSA